MKRLLFIIAALFATAQAQTIQTIGAPTTTVVSRGNFRTDSIFYLPKRTKLPTDSGAVRYQISDSSVYYWTGSQWRRLGVHIDTASMLNPYLRGSGTANYLPIFDASRSVINSKVYQTGTNLLFNTTTPSFTTSGISTIENNATSSAVYTFKTNDSLRAYIGWGGASTMDINNLRSGDIRFYTAATLRGRFQTDGTFRLNSLTGTGSRIVVADANGVLSATSSATGLVDTTVLSTRAWRQKGIDSVNANVALKVNISDTSSMLTNYIRHAGNGLTKSGQALSVDTAAIATRARVQKGIDSVATLASAGVTSVATGYGLSGGTITTTGTIIVDSAIVASRLRVGKVVDSLALVKQNVLTNPVTGTGTTNYVPKFTGTSIIGNSTIFDDGEVKINTTSDAGAYTFQVSGNLYNTTGAYFAASSGQVGIGISPSYKLDVSGFTRVSGNTYLGTNSASIVRIGTVNDLGIGQFGIQTDGGTGATIGIYSPSTTNGGRIVFNDNLYNAEIRSVPVDPSGTNLAFHTNGSERYRITTAGELLLATTTDAGDYKLQVSGNAYVTGTTVLAATSGNVGVGTTSPGAKLTVNLASGFNIITATGPEYAQIRHTDGTRVFFTQVYNNAANIGTESNTPLILSTNNTEKLRVHANGGLWFQGQSSAPTATAGTVYYNSTDNKLKVYNGTTWVDLH